MNYLKDYPTYNLLCPFFRHPLDSRNREFMECLEKNIENKYIKKIYLFWQGYDRNLDSIDLDNKVVVIPLNTRQTYKELADYGNSQLKDEICMIANTDIWFDSSLKNIPKYDLTRTILCLTRFNNATDYEIESDLGWSHDVWIFKSPLKEFDYNLTMGILGCDTLFHIRASRAGYILLNPCYEIKPYHEHNSTSIDSHTRNNKFDDKKSYTDTEEWYDFRIPPMLEYK